MGRSNSVDEQQQTAELQRLGVPLNPCQMQVLGTYSDLVKRWNAVAGLVAKGDLERFFARHLLDSLALAPLIRTLEGIGEVAPPIADFGSGAGLPGVPLAVALPELAFLLVERSEKKARFLRRVRDHLTLPNLSVLCADFRELPQNACRAVVARAALPPQRLWPYARAALRPGGYLLALDRTTRCRRPPDSAPAGCFRGGAVRRHWVEMPLLGAWHGVLEVREEV